MSVLFKMLSSGMIQYEQQKLRVQITIILM